VFAARPKGKAPSVYKLDPEAWMVISDQTRKAGRVTRTNHKKARGCQFGDNSAVRASGPTARPAHASAQLIDADLDAAFSSLFSLGRCDPTDPLVSRRWGNVRPEALRIGVRFDGFPEVCGQFVHRAARDLLSNHASNRACFAQRDGDKPRQGVVANRNSGV